MEKNMIDQKDDVIKILSGGLGDGMNKHNYKERVNAAIAATGYLSRRLMEMYEKQAKARGEQ